MLHNKAYGGNLAIKIDIAKAFDTMDWNFMLKVLSAFGFNNTFCGWIKSILCSAKLSISVNGKLEGYFSCTRGVRQGDPLSPLLFCLAEEVLSRGLTKLVEADQLKLIKGTRSHHIPSHILYADDVMLFCKGTSENIQTLVNFFNRYAEISGQIINAQKSTIYAGSISNGRLRDLASSLGFSIGTLPFLYLGVPIFKGKAKASYFQPVVDKIKSKLTAWKASLLSFAGRLQLIKSVIHGMMIYSINIYSWPVNLIKELERFMRNFLWSGDLNSRKLVTVSWNSVCSPISEGGLGIRSLSKLNDASNLKLCWELMHSDNQWAIFLRSRVMRGNKFVAYHIYSSLWSGIKSQAIHVGNNTSWLIGDGKKINFWLSNWTGSPLVNTFNIPIHTQNQLQSTVNDYIHNSQWRLPLTLQQMFPNLLHHIKEVILPIVQKEDQLIWIHNTSGVLSLKDAYLFYSPARPVKHWAKLIWNAAIPPSKSFITWRIIHRKMPTDENLMYRGCCLPSRCNLCCKHIESAEHLFLQCSFSTSLWNWLIATIKLSLNLSSVTALFDVTNRTISRHRKTVLISAVVSTLNVIWHCRNISRYKNQKPSLNYATSMITASVSLTGNLSREVSGPSITDFKILKAFKVDTHPPNVPRIIEVLWDPPIPFWFKCNTDGAAMGSPGPAACAGIFRNSNGESVGCFASNLGVANSLYAELMGIILAIECAKERNWKNIWLETDSRLASLAVKSPKIVPWQLKNRWLNCIYMMNELNFMTTHIYREGNHCADKLATVGLSVTNFTWWTSAPVIIREDLVKNRLGLTYYRFN